MSITSMMLLGCTFKNKHIFLMMSFFIPLLANNLLYLRSLDRTLRKLCDLCGVRYFNSHEIRKTFATMLHYNNVPTKVISGLMGHSEMSTTERCYILTYADEYKQVLGYMSDALKYKKRQSQRTVS